MVVVRFMNVTIINCCYTHCSSSDCLTDSTPITNWPPLVSSSQDYFAHLQNLDHTSAYLPL